MNIQEALQKAYEILKVTEKETYMLDSQLLLAETMHRDKMFIITHREYELSEEEIDQFFLYINMRKNKMPVKYILRQCEFMGMDFYVRPGVLIPRPDTEILAEWAVNTIRDNVQYSIWKAPVMVCDLCCGSGAIGLSVANISKKHGIKTIVELLDISEDALQVTNENIKRLELHEICTVHHSDMFEKPLDEGLKYDLLLSNPPYISEEDMLELMEDVKNYEPELALCGGSDGLNFYRKIAHECTQILSPCGYIGLEIGYDQGKAVSELLRQNNFKEVNVMKDFNGLDRVVTGHL